MVSSRAGTYFHVYILKVILTFYSVMSCYIIFLASIIHNSWLQLYVQILFFILQDISVALFNTAKKAWYHWPIAFFWKTFCSCKLFVSVVFQKHQIRHILFISGLCGSLIDYIDNYTFSAQRGSYLYFCSYKRGWICIIGARCNIFFISQIVQD